MLDRASLELMSRDRMTERKEQEEEDEDIVSRWEVMAMSHPTCECVCVCVCSLVAFPCIILGSVCGNRPEY